jgi:hypothetical protein
MVHTVTGRAAAVTGSWTAPGGDTEGFSGRSGTTTGQTPTAGVVTGSRSDAGTLVGSTGVGGVVRGTRAAGGRVSGQPLRLDGDLATTRHASVALRPGVLTHRAASAGRRGGLGVTWGTLRAAGVVQVPTDFSGSTAGTFTVAEARVAGSAVTPREIPTTVTTVPRPSTTVRTVFKRRGGVRRGV